MRKKSSHGSEFSESAEEDSESETVVDDEEALLPQIKPWDVFEVNLYRFELKTAIINYWIGKTSISGFWICQVQGMDEKI